jgi:hypothetical protein
VRSKQVRIREYIHQKAGHRQLEKCIGDLQHEDMGVPMVVHDEDALDSPSHAKIFIVVLEALEARRDRGVLFWLGFFRAKCEVGERI